MIDLSAYDLRHLVTQATKGVTQVYEALEALSTRLQKFLDRLAIHFEAPSEPIPALQAIFAKTLVQILHIFAIYTKYVDREVSKISAVRLSVRRFAGRISKGFFYCRPVPKRV